MNKADYLKINLNEYVYVKLTKKGFDEWRKYYGVPDTNEETKWMKEYCNNEGYTKFQLHNFIEIFGKFHAMSIHNTLFDLDVLFDKAQLKEIE